jgi:hypothetical protein
MVLYSGTELGDWSSKHRYYRCFVGKKSKTLFPAPFFVATKTEIFTSNKSPLLNEFIADFFDSTLFRLLFDDRRKIAYLDAFNCEQN